MAKDVAVPNDREMLPWEEMRQHIGQLAELDPVDSFSVAARVINEIAQADTAEAIFAANESGPGDVEDYLGSTIGLMRLQFAESSEEFAEGTLGYYAIMHVQVAGKPETQFEPLILTVGAPNVVASVYRMMRLGLFTEDNPVWFRIKGRKTRRGTLYTVHAG